jgi:hypothetical protein
VRSRHAHWYFISSRFCCSASERLAGGLGIMADDVIAGLLAGVLILVLIQSRLLG